MLVWKKYSKTSYGKVIGERKWLLLFGFIPLFVYINGK